jgi:hypothetical protein
MPLRYPGLLRSPCARPLLLAALTLSFALPALSARPPSSRSSPPSSLPSAQPCTEPSFESASHLRALPAWLVDRCWHRTRSLTALPVTPERRLARPQVFADASVARADIPSPAETRPLPLTGFGLTGDREAPGQQAELAYGDHGAVYGWVARMTGEARSPHKEAVRRAISDLQMQMPSVIGTPTVQMLALGCLVSVVVVRRRRPGG